MYKFPLSNIVITLDHYQKKRETEIQKHRLGDEGQDFSVLQMYSSVNFKFFFAD